MNILKRLWIKVVKFAKPEQNISDWDFINLGICPNCMSEELYVTARGGEAENVLCDSCGSRYWWCPVFKEIGTKKIE